MAFGNGAASYVDKVRETRPRSISKYFKFVEKLQSGENTGQERDSDLDIARTILVCGLRTVYGVNLTRIKPYIGEKEF
jgi:coproporphyrinogen III oxidase-like Fe-S oxidoreductase